MRSDTFNIRKRIADLTADQRRRLAKRLRPRTIGSTQPGGRNASAVAFVVLRSNCANGQQALVELRSLAKSSLPTSMQPSDFRIVTELPRLPNGKIDRRLLSSGALRQQSTVGDIITKTTEEELNDIESKLVTIWQDVLHVEPVRRDDNFFELGGDSIQSIRITSMARQVGLLLEPGDVLEWPTIGELAERARFATGEKATEHATPIQAPLTPIQHWFFDLAGDNPGHWNQAVAVNIERSFSEDKIRNAIEVLVTHHEALRTRFRKNSDGSWEQFVSGELTSILETIDVAHQRDKARSTDAVLQMIDALHADIRPQAGLPVRMALIDVGHPEHKTLFFAAHHLVVDAFSWAIILSDLDVLLSQVSKGGEQRLPEKTTTLLSWANILSHHANSLALRDEESYWLHQCETETDLPIDFDTPESPTEADTGLVLRTVENAVSNALLSQLPGQHSAKTEEIVLAAFARTLQEWTRQNELMIGVERHGRNTLDEADLSRTVGWLTSYFPLRLDLARSHDHDELLRTTKEAVRNVPNGGLGYGMLRYMAHPTPERLPLVRPKVLFNYLGNLSRNYSDLTNLSSSELPIGTCRRPSFAREPLVEFNAYTSGAKLRVEWRYSLLHFKKDSLEALSSSFTKHLTDLVFHCVREQDRSYSTSDFPDVDLKQEDLHRLLSQISRSPEDQPGYDE